MNILSRTPTHLEVRQLSDSGPEILSGSFEDSEDPEQLVDLGITLKQRSPVDHLGVDGSNGPDVDGTRILGGSEQNFWSSVPQGHNLVSVHSDLIINDENITIYFVTSY